MARATKKAAVITGSHPAADKLNIPAAIRPGAASSNPLDLLSELSGATPVAKVATASKSRAGVELSGPLEAGIREWIPAKVLYDLFKTNSDNQKEELDDELFAVYVENMWRQKSQPSNPGIKLNKPNTNKPDIETIFIVQGKFKVNAKSAAEAIELLKASGLHPDDADKLIKAEVDFSPSTFIRPFKELVNGHYEDKETFVEATDVEKAAGTKLLKFVMGQTTEAFTAEERAVVVVNEPEIKVKSGFLERVCGYARTAEQLSSIFKVIKPQYYLKGAKFGISDTLDEKNTRLVGAVASILGVEMGVEK